jgi:ADP-heptose:LPS heptosyltransferase
MPRNKGRNVLVARFSALGDVAMSLPAVYNACRANPDTKFVFLTRHHPAQVFINRPENLTVMGVNLDNYKGVNGIWRLARSLMKLYEIDTFVDLHDVLRTKLLRIFLRMQGVDVFHIRKGRKAKKELTRRNNKVLLQLKPTTQRYENVFRAAGIALDNDFKSLYGSAKGDPSEFAMVTAPKSVGEHWMAVAPFAKHAGKIYPMELLEKVIAHFDAKGGEKIFIFGFGDEECAAIDRLAKKYPSVVNMAAANLGIGAELALLSHCDVMLSMDSANMHLASLVGLRAVTIWGATHPYTGFLGWNQHTGDVVQLEMTCRPCSVFGDKPCFRGDYHCLRGIPPQLVINKIEN